MGTDSNYCFNYHYSFSHSVNSLIFKSCHFIIKVINAEDLAMIWRCYYFMNSNSYVVVSVINNPQIGKDLAINNFFYYYFDICCSPSYFHLHP